MTIFKDVVRLGQTFEVGPGPNYKVYLVEAGTIKESDDVKKSKFVDLGLLRAFKGGQNYKVPAGIDLSKYKSVVIWCEIFGVLISPAKLDFRGS
ncbi:MAG: DM13 domain-containing protein [Rhodospirillales bacterium]